MRTNPFLDGLLFLIGHDYNYKPLGAAQYALIVLFDLLLVCNLWLLVYNYRQDPAQRRGHQPAGVIADRTAWAMAPRPYQPQTI